MVIKFSWPHCLSFIIKYIEWYAIWSFQLRSIVEYRSFKLYRRNNHETILCCKHAVQVFDWYVKCFNLFPLSFFQDSCSMCMARLVEIWTAESQLIKHAMKSHGKPFKISYRYPLATRWRIRLLPPCSSSSCYKTNLKYFASLLKGKQ